MNILPYSLYLLHSHYLRGFIHFPVYLAKILNILFYHSYYLRDVNTFTCIFSRNIYYSVLFLHTTFSLSQRCLDISLYVYFAEIWNILSTLYILHSHYLRGVYTFSCIFSRNIEYSVLRSTYYIFTISEVSCIFSRDIEYSVLPFLLSQRF